MPPIDGINTRGPRAGRGGGFVLSGCNVIFKEIPAANYQAMVDAKLKYGTFADQVTA